MDTRRAPRNPRPMPSAHAAIRPGRPDRDDRDWRTPLDKPPFGDPPWAQRCTKCDDWYPYQSFYRPRRYGKRQPRYKLCLNCR